MLLIIWIIYYSLQLCQDFMDYLIFFAGFAFSLSALLAPNGALSPSSDGFKWGGLSKDSKLGPVAIICIQKETRFLKKLNWGDVGQTFPFTNSSFGFSVLNYFTIFTLEGTCYQCYPLSQPMRGNMDWNVSIVMLLLKTNQCQNDLNNLTFNFAPGGWEGDKKR